MRDEQGEQNIVDEQAGMVTLKDIGKVIGVIVLFMCVAIVPSLIVIQLMGTFDRIEAVRQEGIERRNAPEAEEKAKLDKIQAKAEERLAKIQAEQDKIVAGFVKEVSSELETQLILQPQILAGNWSIILGDEELLSQESETNRKFESTMETFVATAKAKNAQGLLNDTRITLNILDGEYSITP